VYSIIREKQRKETGIKFQRKKGKTQRAISLFGKPSKNRKMEWIKEEAGMAGMGSRGGLRFNK